MDAFAIGDALASTEPVTRSEFVAWVTPYLPAIRRYAARLVGVDDLDDVVQEALLRAWRRRATYDPERGEPLPWLLAIVADRARRHRTRRRPALALADHDQPVDPLQPDIDLERALLRLSRRQREVVDLYYFVDLDVTTVARVVGCAPGTVRATLHQARAALRELLGDLDD